MTRPRVIVTLIAFKPDGTEVTFQDDLSGELQASTQLTTWLHDCGQKFYEQYRETKCDS